MQTSHVSQMRQLYVYILASDDRRLYTGVTNCLRDRIAQHRCGVPEAYSRRNETFKLVYFERLGPLRSAIAREKQIKAWTRLKRINLIESMNAEWQDLSGSLPFD